MTGISPLLSEEVVPAAEWDELKTRYEVRTDDELRPYVSPRPGHRVYSDVDEGKFGPAALRGPYKLTDVGNAERLVDAHGRDLRYVARWEAWFVWDGRRWREDALGRVVELAKEVVRAMWAELAKEHDTARRKQLASWVVKSEGAQRIAAMGRLARSDPRVAVEPDQLDRDPWLFNVENGTVELRTGTCRPHRREDLITKLAPVAYDRDALCPTWKRALERSLADVEVEAFVQEAFGYALTGSVSEQVLFFLHGGGANGKTTIIEAGLGLVGEYGRTIDSEVLLARRESHPTGLTDLKGARMVATSEIDEGRRLAEATLKKLTGGGTITARRMRQDFFEFNPTHKLFIDANHRPVVRGTDHAIWRRLRLIPFNVTIPRAEWDKDLPAKLAAERPGILNWAIEGCLRWQQEGLSYPEAVQAATVAYQAEMDVLADFLEACCVVEEHAFVAAENLYVDYTRWCEATGETALTQRALGTRLTERGFQRRKHGASRRWHWFGVGLVNPRTDADPDSLFPPYACVHDGGIRETGSDGYKGSPQAQAKGQAGSLSP